VVSPERSLPPASTPEASLPVSALPTPATKPSIVDQYELGDTGYDNSAVLSSDPATSEEAPAVAPLPEPASSRPRDASGRFLPQDGPKHSSRTLRMAQDLGLSDQEIAETPPDMLDDVVYHMNRQAMKLAREHSTQALLQSPGDRTLAQQPPKSAGQAPPEPDEEGFGALEEQLDPNLMGVIKRQAKEMKELKAMIGQLAQHEQVRQTESMAQQIDRAFEGLGEAYQGILGKGRGIELQADSPHYARRLAVLAEVQRANTPGTMEQQITKAVKTLYGDRGPKQAAQPAGRQPAARRNGYSAEEWERGGLARPTQRAGAAEPPGDQKAMRTAAAFMREQGVLDEPELSPDAFPE